MRVLYYELVKTVGSLRMNAHKHISTKVPVLLSTIAESGGLYLRSAMDVPKNSHMYRAMLR